MRGFRRFKFKGNKFLEYFLISKSDDWVNWWLTNKRLIFCISDESSIFFRDKLIVNVPKFQATFLEPIS